MTKLAETNYYPSGSSMYYDCWKEKRKNKNNINNRRKRPLTKQSHQILNIKMLAKFFPKDFFEPKNNKTEISKRNINNDGKTKTKN